MVQAQGELVEKMFPNGATIINLQGQSGASPAIDRNKGLHNVLDKAKDKYKIVFEQTAGFDRSKGLSVTEAALAGMATPPQVIVAANDDMALGALEAVKARNSALLLGNLLVLHSISGDRRQHSFNRGGQLHSSLTPGVGDQPG